MNPERKSTFGKRKPESGEFHISSCERVEAPAKVLPKSIRLIFRAEKLSKRDLFSSDPFLVIYGTPYPSASGIPPHIAYYQDNMRKLIAPDVSAPLLIIGKTEVLKKNLNPTWKPLEIPLELSGGLTGRMTIICYDYNSDGTHAEIGRCVASLKTLTSPDPLLPLILPERVGQLKGIGGTYQNSGILRVHSFEEIHGYADYKPAAFDFSVSMRKLARMDFGGLGKCDPFICISSQVISQPDASQQPVYRNVVIFKSEIVYKTLSPVFKPFQISLIDCGGLDNQLLFEVYDKDPKGQELVGSFKTTLRELSMPQFNEFHLRNPKHLSSCSGVVTINSCTPTFTLSNPDSYAHAYTFKAGVKHLERSNSAFVIYGGKGGPSILNGSVVNGSKNPVYEPFTLDVQKCGGLDGPLYFEFNDYSNPAHIIFIGGFNTTLRELNMYKSSPPIPLIDPKRVGIGYKSSGDFEVFSSESLGGAPGQSFYSPAQASYYPPAPGSYYPPQPAHPNSYYPPPAYPGGDPAYDHQPPAPLPSSPHENGPGPSC